MIRSSDNRWLHRFAVLTAAATFCLLWVGGLVTSHGVGMSVPDWPTTYGYNMFFFPFSKWVGGIFYEHSHRLVASGVGLLTAILAAWVWSVESRGWTRRIALGGIIAAGGLMGVRTQAVLIGVACAAAVMLVFSLVRLLREEKKLRWLAAIAFCAVLIQGVLGGLRVTQMKDVIGVFHATLAQLFFGLVCAIALFTSRWWLQADKTNMSIYAASGLRYSFATVTGLILLQLILGAAMRHQHAGLAIPDFPASYGKLWPAMDAESVAHYNQARGEVTAMNPITSLQIGLQMAHRIMAFLILVSVAWVAGAARRRAGGQSVLAKLSFAWLALILVQATLGAATIWTNKAADLATAHVATGALCLVNGVMLALMASRLLRRDSTATPARVAVNSLQQPAKATA
jgi:cytochrome c oxidase assembly protein subunit 15